MAFISLSVIVAIRTPFYKHQGGEEEHRQTDSVSENRDERGIEERKEKEKKRREGRQEEEIQHREERGWARRNRQKWLLEAVLFHPGPTRVQGNNGSWSQPGFNRKNMEKSLAAQPTPALSLPVPGRG